MTASVADVVAAILLVEMIRDEAADLGDWPRVDRLNAHLKTLKQKLGAAVARGKAA